MILEWIADHPSSASILFLFTRDKLITCIAIDYVICYKPCCAAGNCPGLFIGKRLFLRLAWQPFENRYSFICYFLYFLIFLFIFYLFFIFTKWTSKIIKHAERDSNTEMTTIEIIKTWWSVNSMSASRINTQEKKSNDPQSRNAKLLNVRPAQLTCSNVVVNVIWSHNLWPAFLTQENTNEIGLGCICR